MGCEIFSVRKLTDKKFVLEKKGLYICMPIVGLPLLGHFLQECRMGEVGADWQSCPKAIEQKKF